MKQYLDLLRHVMTNGKDRGDRTGTGTRAVFGHQMRMDLRKGLPLLTTKKIHVKSVIHELLWFLRGETNVRSLQAAGVTIWDEWADENGDLGPVYGDQWRFWPDYRSSISIDGEVTVGTIDQVKALILGITETPNSRRLIVSAWNPSDVPFMKLPPCHTLWQCQVDAGTLHLHLYARSIDAFLGLPFNIASYGFLLSMLAQVTGLIAGELVISFGDLHIYRNHFEQVELQLARTPRELPTLEFSHFRTSIDDFRFTDFNILGYDPHPTIKAPIAV